MRARLVVIGSMIALGGCSALISLDSLREDGGTIVDAANDATTIDDVASDAPILDASGMETFVDAGPVSFCPTTIGDGGTIFCDDFDDSDAATLFAKWTKVVTQGGGVVMRADSDASPPFAVEVTMPIADAGPQAELQRAFVTTPISHATYSYDVRVVQYPSGGLSMNVSPIQLAGSSSEGAVNFLRLTLTTATFYEQLPIDGGFQTFGHTLSAAIASGEWVNVRIEWTITDAGIDTQVFFNQQNVNSLTPLDPRSVFTQPYLMAGLSHEDPSADGAKVDIDNVAFSFE